jgi:hypothetical protein
MPPYVLYTTLCLREGRSDGDQRTRLLPAFPGATCWSAQSKENRVLGIIARPRFKGWPSLPSFGADRQFRRMATTLDSRHIFRTCSNQGRAQVSRVSRVERWGSRSAIVKKEITALITTRASQRSACLESSTTCDPQHFISIEFFFRGREAKV